jgi:putative acetyltransferase
MSITIERVVEAMPEVHNLIGELNDVLGAAYEAHQRHGLSIEQLFEPNVRFFVARVDGLAVGCGAVAICDDYAEVKRMYPRPMARGRGVAKAIVGRIEGEARAAGKFVLRLETGIRQQFSATGSVRPVRCLPATSRPASFSKRRSASSGD